MNVLPSEKKKKRGNKIDVHAYIDAALYNEFAAFQSAVPDAGDRWESALLRKMIREWIAAHQEEPLHRGDPWTGAAAHDKPIVAGRAPRLRTRAEPKDRSAR